MPHPLYAPALRAALSQGDILEGVRIAEPHLGAGERTFRVMALSHACEIDKEHNKVMLVGSVRPLSDFNPADHDRIRNKEVLSVFHLPADPPAVPIERCVDFRQLYRTSFSAIGATGFAVINGQKQRVFPGADPRTLSLSDHGITVLHGRIVAFFTRSRDWPGA